MKSSEICQEIIKYLDNNAVIIKKVKRMAIGQVVQLKGKIGKILAFAILNGRLLVWLEMNFNSRHRVLSTGVIAPLTIHCGIIL